MDATLLTGLLWFAAFLFSTTVHEAMHALVAYHAGDATAYLGDAPRRHLLLSQLR